MKLPHTAAIALGSWYLTSGQNAFALNWYLLTPPNSDLPVIARDAGFFSIFGGPLVLRDNVTMEQVIVITERGDWATPVSWDWIVLDSYENLDSCKSGRATQLKLAEEQQGKNLSDFEKEQYQFILRYAAARCIATDDPRLSWRLF